MRICSLLPSATEILYALGLGDSVVGVTHECDFPPEAGQKPRVIRPRVDPSAPPAELDCQVKQFLARGESLYAVDDALLRGLRPDLIVTQDLCHVCAAVPDDLASVLARLADPPQVLSLSPRTLEDVWADIRRVGQATGRAAEAEALAARLARRVEEVAGAISGACERPRVLCLEWLDPPYVAGHWVPEMAAKAGGFDVLGRAGEPGFPESWQKILSAGPEVVVVMPCGYDLARTRREFQRLKLPAGWEDLPAARKGRVFAVDANCYFSRPGPRLADGVALLARLIHPRCNVWGAPAQAACPLSHTSEQSSEW